MEQKDVHSSSPARTPKLQLAAEQLLTGESDMAEHSCTFYMYSGHKSLTRYETFSHCGG